jgi:hypothetical protein
VLTVPPPLRLQSDVYSFGVSLWEMVERKRPFESLDALQICALWISDPSQLVLPPLTVPEGARTAELRACAALQQLVSSWGLPLGVRWRLAGGEGPTAGHNRPPLRSGAATRSRLHGCTGGCCCAWQGAPWHARQPARPGCP